MTLLKAIAEANELRPNAISDDIKASWVFKLDCEVAELMDIEESEEEESRYPKNTFPEDCELLMPKEHDNIYTLYVCAMIDFVMEDTQAYINDMTIANSEKMDAFMWWRRHHEKKCQQKIRAYPFQPKLKGENDEPTRTPDEDTEEGTTDIPTVGD